jgi:shikimate kinase
MSISMRLNETEDEGVKTAPVFLVGYRGTGKSSVARALAANLGWEWVDADELLEERFGRTIRTIFAEEGEAGFREKEASLLEELCTLRKHVIATGGGVVLRPSNRERMNAAGRVVWLIADAQTIWNRLQSDATSAERRPNLTVGGLTEIVDLLKVREPYYSACADFTVDTRGHSAEEVAAVIVEHLKSDQTFGTLSEPEA